MIRKFIDKYLKNIPLKIHLAIVYFFSLAIIMVLSGYYLINQSKEVMLKVVSHSQNQTLRQVSERADIIKNSSITALNLYTNNTYVRNHLSDENYKVLTEYIDDTKMQYDNIFKDIGIQYELIILSENGNNYHSKYGENYDFDELKSLLVFNNSYNTSEDFNFISSFNDKFGNEEINHVFSISREIFGEDNDLISTFIITVKEKFLKELYDDLLSDNIIYIVDEKGNVVSHMDDNYLGLNYFNHNNFNEIFKGKKYPIAKKTTGNQLITVVKNAETGWYVVEEIPTVKVFKEVDKLIQIIVVILITSFIVIYLVSVGVIEIMMKPIYRLSTKMNMVKSGDLTIRSEGSSYKEVNDLNRAFDEMAIQIHDLIETTMVQEIYRRDLEMNFLRAQINPHFLYNTLFSMRCLLEMDKTEGLLDMVDAFSGLLHATFSSNLDFITIGNELDTVQKYILLQKIRYNDKFDFEILIEQGLEDCLIPPLILQPLVENAIFHGIEPKNDYGGITISIYSEEDKVVIDVIDNGIGMSEDKIVKLNQIILENALNPDKSIGISNVSNRLYLAYSGKSSIDIISELNFGTIIRISIPRYKEDNHESINRR